LESLALRPAIPESGLSSRAVLLRDSASDRPAHPPVQL
jgi:hypothetical protein